VFANQIRIFLALIHLQITVHSILQQETVKIATFITVITQANLQMENAIVKTTVVDKIANTLDKMYVMEMVNQIVMELEYLLIVHAMPVFMEKIVHVKGFLPV
jgi:hypothetical protein